MISIKILPLLFGVGLCQLQHSLLGGIPSQIHHEIFGVTPKPQLYYYNSANVIPRSYASPFNPYSHQITVAHPDQIGYRTNFRQNISRIPSPNELFAPAIVKTPAATKGQMEAYIKALEMEAMDEQKELEMATMTNQYLLSDLQPKALSYVNVKLGGSQYQYHA